MIAHSTKNLGLERPRRDVAMDASLGGFGGYTLSSRCRESQLGKPKIVRGGVLVCSKAVISKSIFPRSSLLCKYHTYDNFDRACYDSTG